MFLFFLIFLSSCSSTTKKLDDSVVGKNQKIIFGKFLSATEDTRDLRFTYMLEKTDTPSLLSLDNLFPNIDPETGYFWVSVPQGTKFFGVRSIHFTQKVTGGVAAVLRDEEKHESLLGTELSLDQNPIYVGDVVTTTVTTTGHEMKRNWTFQSRIGISDIKIVNNFGSAKKFITERGFKNAQISVLKPTHRL